MPRIRDLLHHDFSNISNAPRPLILGQIEHTKRRKYNGAREASIARFVEEKTRRDIPRTNRKMPHTRKAYGRLYIIASESVPNTDLLVRVSSAEHG